MNVASWMWQRERARGLCAHLMKQREYPSHSTKLLALSLTRLLFTHLFTKLLVVVLVEYFFLILLRTWDVYILYDCTQKNAIKDKDLTHFV